MADLYLNSTCTVVIFTDAASLFLYSHLTDYSDALFDSLDALIDAEVGAIGDLKDGSFESLNDGTDALFDGTGYINLTTTSAIAVATSTVDIDIEIYVSANSEIVFNLTSVDVVLDIGLSANAAVVFSTSEPTLSVYPVKELSSTCAVTFDLSIFELQYYTPITANSAVVFTLNQPNLGVPLYISANCNAITYTDPDVIIVSDIALTANSSVVFSFARLGLNLGDLGIVVEPGYTSLTPIYGYNYINIIQ